MENEEGDQEIIESLRAIAKDSSEIEQLVSDLNSSFESTFFSNRNQHYSSVKGKYALIISKIDRIIRQSQQSIIMTKGCDENKEIPQPIIKIEPETPEIRMHRPHEMFELFVTRELPINSFPYPPLCGATPPNLQVSLQIDDFVAAKLENDYVLCYIAGITGNSYTIVDCDTDKPSPISLPKESVIPLPTSIPDRSNSYVEYVIGTKVLSLYPAGDDEWTSVFYPATVIQPPSKRECGYGLQFAEDNEFDWISVPEQFVIPFPNE